MVSVRYDDADVELVRSFANTVDVEDQTDRLASSDEFRSWLRDQGLLGADESIGDDDLALARELRRALRAEMASHHDDVPDPAARAALDRLAADLPVRIVPSSGALEPVARGLPRRPDASPGVDAEPGARRGLEPAEGLP